jgi:hypothetical protein
MTQSPRLRTLAFVAALSAVAYAAVALENPFDAHQGRSTPATLASATNGSVTAHDSDAAVLSDGPSKAPDTASTSDAITTTSNSARNGNGDRNNGNGGFVYQSNGIPVGFEAWFEAQRVALDVFYGGRYLLTTLAEYHNGEVTLLQSAQVAARIPGALDVELLSSLLAQPLAANAERVCGADLR